MGAPKVGDRVKVEFEGEVRRVTDDKGAVNYVEVAPTNGAPFVAVAARLDQCTVIVPPVKVGDIVTADNIGQLPNGSIAAPVGEKYNPYFKRDRWWELAERGYIAVCDEDVTADESVALRVGDGS